MLDNQKIGALRLQAQQIASSKLNSVADLVTHMGAMQAQDLAMVKWAIGIRHSPILEADVEKAFAEGSILRTHLLRPTWHVVAAADIHWMLALTAPQVKKVLASRHKQLEITPKLIKKSNDTMGKALEAAQELSRETLVGMLNQAGIDTSENRASHFLLHAELDGLVCSGSVKGNKQNYALLSARVPSKKPIGKEEALAMLARRYFTSHGPATLADFAWWAGLKVTDAREGIELVKKYFSSASDGQTTHWFDESIPEPVPSVYLLPAYDEFIISYKDRSAVLLEKHQNRAMSKNGIFWPTILVDGQVCGIWKRKLNNKKVVFEIDPFLPLSKVLKQKIKKEASAFGDFLGREIHISI